MGVLSSRFGKILMYIVLATSLLSSYGTLAASAANKYNLAVLVPSCDKYSDLWQPFSKLLFKYWPELSTSYPDLPIYLTSNNIPFKHSRIQNIQIPNDNNWSDSLRTALLQIPEDYVLILLEDYFINTPVLDQKFWNSFAFMRAKQAGYLQVSYSVQDADPFVQYPFNIVRKLPNAEYRTSLQAAIWHKPTLLALLKSGENPWRFEIDGAVRSQALNKEFLAISEHTPFNYLNAVNYGVMEAKVIDYLRVHEGIDLTKTKLKLPTNNAWKYRIKPYKKLAFAWVVLPTLCISLLSIVYKLSQISGTRFARLGGTIIFASIFLTLSLGARYLPLARDFFLQYKWQLLILTAGCLLVDLVRNDRGRSSHSRDRLHTLIYLYLYTCLGIVAHITKYTTTSQVCLCITPALLILLGYNVSRIKMQLGLVGKALLLYVLFALAIYPDPVRGSLPIAVWLTLTSPLWFYFGLRKMRTALLN